MWIWQKSWKEWKTDENKNSYHGDWNGIALYGHFWACGSQRQFFIKNQMSIYSSINCVVNYNPDYFGHKISNIKISDLFLLNCYVKNLQLIKYLEKVKNGSVKMIQELGIRTC